MEIPTTTLFDTGLFWIIVLIIGILLLPKKIRSCPESETCTMAKRVGFPNCREVWGRKCTTYYPEEFFREE